jgi:hypothetical protein
LLKNLSKTNRWSLSYDGVTGAGKGFDSLARLPYMGFRKKVIENE